MLALLLLGSVSAEEYSKENGKCKLPDGKTPSTIYTVGDDGEKCDKHTCFKTLRTVDECKEICSKQSDCTGFHRLDSGPFAGKCVFNTEIVKADGLFGTVKTDCYVKV